MPDGQHEAGIRLSAVARNPAAGSGGSKPDCDFAAALLQELTIDPLPIVADVHARFHALPDDEEVAILRALAGEMPTNRLKWKAFARLWRDAARIRLNGLLRTCTRVTALLAAPICSTLLNVDTLAIARRLRADPALRRRSRDDRKM